MEALCLHNATSPEDKQFNHLTGLAGAFCAAGSSAHQRGAAEKQGRNRASIQLSSLSQSLCDNQQPVLSCVHLKHESVPNIRDSARKENNKKFCCQ